MDNIDYMDRVLQVTQLSVYSPQRHYRKCLRQNTTNVDATLKVDTER